MKVVIRKKGGNRSPDKSGRRRRTSSYRRRLFLVFLGICITAAFLGIAGNIFQRRNSIHQISTKPQTHPRKPNPVTIPETPSNLPRIAIIIDDIGYDLKMLDDLLAIDGALTFSVLPGLPHTAEAARRIRESQREVMLHLPMEPLDAQRWNPGPDALLETMNDDLIRETLVRDINSVPGAIGVNNHMGSRFTADERRMTTVLDVLRERGLFFVDSRTAPDSLGYTIARRLGIKSYSSDLFLDHVDSEEYVGRQLESLLHIARSRGRALGIGHPHEATCRVLRAQIPRLKGQGVILAPASMIVE